MPLHPLLQDCVDATGLSADQVEAAAGLALSTLRDRVTVAEFQEVERLLPEAGSWMLKAPERRKSLLGGLAGAVGGSSAQLLMELSRGLTRIGIPSRLHRPLAKALASGVETRYPELRSLAEQLKNR